MITAVEFIEEAIKTRQRNWNDRYQQGNQRALTEIAMYIEEAKQMEVDKCIQDYNAGYDDAQCNHINDAENYANEMKYMRDGDKEKNNDMDKSSNQSTTYDVNVKYNTK